MSDLFRDRREQLLGAVAPLAQRMRPSSLDEFVGQEHIVGFNDDGSPRLLRRMLKAGRITSIILNGPPGTGKTTLAEVIARESGRALFRENAASVGVGRIREILAESQKIVLDGKPPAILFLDEIHRFNKAQQDVLLRDVERGLITLIGATTENPLFTVNSALVSRSTLFRLDALTESDIASVVRRTIADEKRGCGRAKARVDDDAIGVWAIKSDGDARRALTALEVAVLSAEPDANGGIHISRADAEESIQQKAAVYDASGDQHYDHASAFIKSIRGCDPDAAIYWLARMLEGGEDPGFIARRLAILASEDIGNADPRAITIADSAWSLTERVGMPECRIILAQCAIYLALASKSNASYLAIDEALGDVREGRTIPVPYSIRSGLRVPSPDGTRSGDGYVYNHAQQANTSIGHVSSVDYLGVSKRYYEPTERGMEKILKERLEQTRAARQDTPASDTAERAP